MGFFCLVEDRNGHFCVCTIGEACDGLLLCQPDEL